MKDWGGKCKGLDFHKLIKVRYEKFGFLFHSIRLTVDLKCLTFLSGTMDDNTKLLQESKRFVAIATLKALTDHLGGGSRVGSFDPY